MRKQNAHTFEPTKEATADYISRMQERFTRSVFVRGRCTSVNSYYFDSHGDPSLVHPTSVIAANREHTGFPLSDCVFA